MAQPGVDSLPSLKSGLGGGGGVACGTRTHDRGRWEDASFSSTERKLAPRKRDQLVFAWGIKTLF